MSSKTKKKVRLDVEVVFEGFFEEFGSFSDIQTYIKVLGQVRCQYSVGHTDLTIFLKNMTQ